MSVKMIIAERVDMHRERGSGEVLIVRFCGRSIMFFFLMGSREVDVKRCYEQSKEKEKKRRKMARGRRRIVMVNK